MKIDLIYPKIPENSDKFQGKCIAFEKYDGTNMHWVWSLDQGWCKFGTRRTQFTLKKHGIEEFKQIHSELSEAPNIFNDCFRDSLSIFLSHHKIYSRSYNIIVFTEFYGSNSFAGNHSEEDARCNSQKLIIIDVEVNNRIIPPNQLIDDFDSFGRFDVARVVYKGKYSGQFAEDVKNGKYNVNEGVVVKGVVDNEVFMTKIKTKEYLKRLQQR